jgi:hypothetical protein
VLLGMLIRDATRGVVPYLRRVTKALIRRIKRVNRPEDNNLFRFIANTERRIDGLEARQRRSQNAVRETHGRGHTHHSRGRGYYVPPTVNEDTEGEPALAPVAADLAVDSTGAGVGLMPPTRQASLSSAPSSSWSIVQGTPEEESGNEMPALVENINWNQLLREVPRSAQMLEPVLEAPVVEPIPAQAVGPIPAPFNEPIPDAMIAEALIQAAHAAVHDVRSHVVVPMQNCPTLTGERTGIALTPPCVFVSHHGQKIHLYTDGRCLAGANQVGGVRQLKALPVCLVCQARFRGSSSSGQ